MKKIKTGKGNPALCKHGDSSIPAEVVKTST